METLLNREPHIGIWIRIQTPYVNACPVSGEPHAGSWIALEYSPATVILGFDAVAKRLPEYANEARDVETIVQLLAQDAAAALGVPVKVTAHYILRDGITLEATCAHS